MDILLVVLIYTARYKISRSRALPLRHAYPGPALLANGARYDVTSLQLE